MPKVKNSIHLMVTNDFKLATCEEFFHAIEKGNITAVDALYFTDHHLSAKNSANLTALHLAVMKSHEALTQWLLAQGANPDVTDDLDDTPLHLAAIMGQERIVQLLLNSQATINKKDKQGKTPLKLAAELGHTHIVTLLQNNANSHSDNRMGNLSREKIVHHQQQAITHTHTTQDVNVTYIPVPNSSHPRLILEQQLIEKDNLIRMQQEMLTHQQQELQKINDELEHQNQENAQLRAQLSVFSQSMNLSNTYFMPPLFESAVILESTEEKFSNTNQVTHSNLQTKPYP